MPIVRVRSQIDNVILDQSRFRCPRWYAQTERASKKIGKNRDDVDPYHVRALVFVLVNGRSTDVNENVSGNENASDL
jgi:hypothetical protein